MQICSLTKTAGRATVQRPLRSEIGGFFAPANVASPRDLPTQLVRSVGLKVRSKNFSSSVAAHHHQRSTALNYIGPGNASYLATFSEAARPKVPNWQPRFNSVESLRFVIEAMLGEVAEMPERYGSLTEMTAGSHPRGTRDSGSSTAKTG
jgi:hypothetical protein